MHLSRDLRLVLYKFSGMLHCSVWERLLQCLYNYLIVGKSNTFRAICIELTGVYLI